MALISISIDISGSTEIKRIIKDFSSKDKENINLHYSQFIQQLYLLEMRFYESLVNDGVDLKNLFVIKTIGDEIWIVYDLSKDKREYNSNEFNEIVHKIIHALINTIISNSHILVSERKYTQEEENDIEKELKVKSYLIPIVPKVFVDLIEEYEEISSIRYGIFERMFSRLIPFKDQKILLTTAQMDNFKEYLNNLNFGMYMGKSDENNIRVAYRFDPIGFEIDRFFRLTKSSLAGVVTVGQNLFTKISDFQSLKLKKDLGFFKKLRFPYADDRCIRYDYFECIYRKINKETLKGVEQDYFVFHLFKKQLLPSEVRSRVKKNSKHYKAIKDIFSKLRISLFEKHVSD